MERERAAPLVSHFNIPSCIRRIEITEKVETKTLEEAKFGGRGRAQNPNLDDEDGLDGALELCS